MNITIFGSSQTQENSSAYEEGHYLGRQLALSGHTVLTGGYMGTMEAVSRGASEAGGHVVGVTCIDIESWRPIRANAWVKEERRVQTLQERLNGLIEGCDAAVALPGGPGTLTEISLMWNLMIVQALPVKPLILIGAGWQAVFGAMYSSLGDYTPQHQRVHLHFAPDIQSAVEIINRHQ